jgi:hypothetical protein
MADNQQAIGQGSGFTVIINVQIKISAGEGCCKNDTKNKYEKFGLHSPTVLLHLIKINWQTMTS